MISYDEMTKDELKAEKERLLIEYKRYQELNLTLNMARGKPSTEQLDLSMGMLDPITHDEVIVCASCCTDY